MIKVIAGETENIYIYIYKTRFRDKERCSSVDAGLKKNGDGGWVLIGSHESFMLEKKKKQIQLFVYGFFVLHEVRFPNGVEINPKCQ